MRARDRAALRGWRYVIAQGYGSVAPAPGVRVFGVLWRLTPRDLAALNIFESLDSGLYRRAMLTVRDRRAAGARAGLCRRGNAAGAAPMPGYQERLVAAADGLAIAAALCCGAAAPCAGLSRRASGRDRRDRMSRAARRRPRPRAGRRLSRLRRGRRRCVSTSKAGCGTGAMALSRRCFPGPEQSVPRRSSKRAGAGHAAAHVDTIDVAEAASELLRLSAVRASASRSWQRHEERTHRRRASRVPAARGLAGFEHPRRHGCGAADPAARRRLDPRLRRQQQDLRRNGPTAAAPAAAPEAASRSARTSASRASRRRSAARGGPSRRSSYAGLAAASAVAPNSASNSRRSTMSTSGIVTGWPRSTRLVTP